MCRQTFFYKQGFKEKYRKEEKIHTHETRFKYKTKRLRVEREVKQR